MSTRDAATSGCGQLDVVDRQHVGIAIGALEALQHGNWRAARPPANAGSHTIRPTGFGVRSFSITTARPDGHRDR
jgi:hypothetical protein